jgi:hypothetical protein
MILKMKKEFVKTLAKFGFAAIIIYWMINSGKLDFNLLPKAFSHPFNLSIVILLTIFNLLATSWRWKKLMEVKTQTILPFWKITKINWIGLFFNTVLPGMVSGDLVKIFYIRDVDSNLSKRFLLASVLVDRIIGLFSLISLLGIFSLLNYQGLSSLSREVKLLIDFNLLLFLGVIVSFLSLFFFKTLPTKLSPLFKFSRLTEAAWEKVLLLWDNLCETKNRLIFLTFIGIFIHIAAVIMFWVIAGPYAEGTFDLKYAFSFIPTGICRNRHPYSPIWTWSWTLYL